MLFAVAWSLAHHCKVTLLRDGVGNIYPKKCFKWLFSFIMKLLNLHFLQDIMFYALNLFNNRKLQHIYVLNLFYNRKREEVSSSG